MTYEEFKSHILTFLWKQNDLDLIGSLDNLIAMADSELNMVLDVEEASNTVIMYAATNTVQLPYDYGSMDVIASPQIGELNYVRPSDLYARRVGITSGFLNVYSLQGNILLLAGSFGSPGVPLTGDDRLTLIITYDRRIPNYKEADRSWVADKFLSLYTYAVLAQTAPFLREDERVELWLNRYNTIVETMRTEDAHKRARGVGADMALPRNASGAKLGPNRRGR